MDAANFVSIAGNSSWFVVRPVIPKCLYCYLGIYCLAHTVNLECIVLPTLMFLLTNIGTVPCGAHQSERKSWQPWRWSCVYWQEQKQDFRDIWGPLLQKVYILFCNSPIPHIPQTYPVFVVSRWLQVSVHLEKPQPHHSVIPALNWLHH